MGFKVSRWLKRAHECFADLKARTDFALIGAINFNFAPATFFEQRLHRAGGERGRVAIAAEMTEHDALDFPGNNCSITAPRGDIGKMSVTRLDALLHRPRPMRIVLQHFFVVVGFDHERLHFARGVRPTFLWDNQDR